MMPASLEMRRRSTNSTSEGATTSSPCSSARSATGASRPRYARSVRLFLFRLRSHLELEAVLEEVSATYDKKTIASFYREATEEPDSFLCVCLEAKKPKDMFWERFEHRLMP